MQPTAGADVGQSREIVHLRSAGPGLRHSLDVVLRLPLAVDQDVPVTNACFFFFHAAPYTLAPEGDSPAGASPPTTGLVRVFNPFRMIKTGLFKVYRCHQ